MPDGLLARAFRAGLVARNRIAEDELHDAIKRGVRQYVILGAGLDTFAYRNPYPDAALNVFEVDHPTTQNWKQKLLADAAIAAPRNLRFVDIDLGAQSLRERLTAAGFDFNVPSLFSWLGVTMYLDRSTVMETLRLVASGTPGTGIVFDYVPGFSSRNFLGNLFMRMIMARFAKLGEPWIGLFDPAILFMELKAMGFSHVTDMDVEALNRRFFVHRKDSLRFNETGLKAIKLGNVVVARL